MPYQTPTNNYQFTKYIVDPTDGPYTTIQAAANAAAAEAVATGVAQCVIIRSGTYTENLTLPVNVAFRAADANVDTRCVNIIGTHTPSAAAGYCTFEAVNFFGTTAVFASAAAGACHFSCETCNFSISGVGYIFDMPNWTAGFGIITSGDLSVNEGGTSGFINNATGSSAVDILYCGIGWGTTNSLQINGTLLCYGSFINCPITIGGAGNSIIKHTDVNQTIVFEDAAQCAVTQCYLNPGGVTPAVVQNSASEIILSDVSINSSAVPAIDGAGVGNLVIGSITYISETGIAGTVTKDFSTRLETGELKIDDAENGILIATNGVVSTGGGVLDQEQIFYVGKHGNDLNDGLSIGNAVLTFTQALVLAAAATPTALNPISIVCFDDGIYAESFTIISYVNVWAPNAEITGALIGQDFARIKLRQLNVAAGTVGVGKIAGTNYFRAEIGTVDCAGDGIGFLCLSGSMNCRWKIMNIVNGFGIGDGTSAAAEMHLDGHDIYISGVGTGIARANAGETKGLVHSIENAGAGTGTGILCLGGTIEVNINNLNVTTGINHDVGTINAFINTITCTAAYDVANGATLNLHVGALSGTETVGATGVRNLFRTDGSSYFPGNLTISRTTGGAGTVSATIANTHNAAAASNAALNISVGGTTSTGDPYINYLVTGGDTWSSGIDNSDSDKFKLSPTADIGTPSTNLSNEYQLLSRYNIHRYSYSGGDVSTWIMQLSNTANSEAKLKIYIPGTTAADPYVNYFINSGGEFSSGIDNSDSDKWKITTGASPSAGTEAVSIDSSGQVWIPTRLNVGSASTTFSAQYLVYARQSRAGSLVGMYVENTENSSSTSDSSYTVRTYASGGDPFINIQVDNVTQQYSIGADNSDSDKLKITTGATPSAGTEIIVSTAAGEVTMPVQPSFLAYLAADATDKTGAGTAYTLGTDALTEVFDRNSDFNVNGTFTAPVTGIYDLRANVSIIGTTIATTFVISIVTTARTYTHTYTRAAGSTDQSMFISCLADMAATNTATVTITVTGEAADTADIDGGASCLTYFCGALVC